MADKKFLTIDEQIAHLKNDKKIYCDERHKKSLLTIGYFNLINGYKTPFTSSEDANGNHIYAKNTTLDELINLKNFDDDLRHILIRCLTKCEEEIKTIASYLLEKTKPESISWENHASYNEMHDGSNLDEINKLISSIQKQLDERGDLEYVRFYQSSHKGKIPMWVITKAVYFGTFINLIELSKQSVKDSLCDLYNIRLCFTCLLIFRPELF